MIPNHPCALESWLDWQRIAVEIGRGHAFDVAVKIVSRPGLQGKSDRFLCRLWEPSPDLGRAVVQTDRVLSGSRLAGCWQ
jgi:hypothetical protein